MNRIVLASLLAATVLAPAAAQAQSSDTGSFQGPYVGAQVGWNHDIAINAKKDAVVGGVYAGYDREVSPNIILGAEAGFTLAASDRIGPSGANSATIDPLHAFDVSARAGYVLGGRNLLYVRGGYENQRARVSSISTGLTTSGERTYDGWFVGGGVERKLLSNVSTRLEYRYADLGKDDRKFQQHQVLLGVAYRF